MSSLPRWLVVLFVIVLLLCLGLGGAYFFLRYQRGIGSSQEERSLEEQQTKPTISQPELENSNYKEYLEKYPQNVSSFTQEVFGLVGEVVEVEDEYLVLEINGDKIQINCSSESKIGSVSGATETAVPFESSLLKLGTEEFMTVKKGETGELVLISILRITE